MSMYILDVQVMKLYSLSNMVLQLNEVSKFVLEITWFWVQLMINLASGN